MNRPRHAKEILDAFERHWGNEGRPSPELKHDDPLDGLMLTLVHRIRTTGTGQGLENQSRISAVGYGRISCENIVDLIRVAGLGETKAARMKQILKYHDTLKLLDRRAENWDMAEAREFLVSLPGVGVKTAACPRIRSRSTRLPVDTNIARLSRRLGWAPEKMTPDKIQEYLESTLPGERFRGAHLNMIEHGRGICSARKPECGKCYAKKWCQFAKSLDG